MRRFYIVPLTLLHEMVPNRDLRYHDLFISAGGFHYINLDATHILLCCDSFARTTDEEAWHAHPEVARLHHPVNAPTAKLSELLLPKHKHKQIQQKHLDALAQIGVTPQDTVGDVSVKASAFHPLVRLDKEY